MILGGNEVPSKSSNMEGQRDEKSRLSVKCLLVAILMWWCHLPDQCWDLKAYFMLLHYRKMRKIIVPY